ncbi:inactive glucose-1-phosphate adenylyltransferase small subunit 2, chloroplastic isoform X2 [Citrus sinensis]|uniref:inactive glucose-1-phosphate adenylyltransferase small subunit 2, chloroplastic isoform X2 n=1 Tax=Citrus sinensis TaxID=2711 RepID=UPI002277F5F7|nr:inactive glucose-1-phosphate adenylyltransferase small subunit 2, chloroplastic isoform X2 [Citrus sinensis]
MVTLQLSCPIIVKHQAKLPILGLARNQQKHLSKLPSSFPASLYLCNSQEPYYPVPLFPPVDQSVAAVVFGDGSESRLYPLTKRRSEGAIPLAANYRLVDAVVSNCINSNINKIYALTQFNSTSLNLHLSRAFSGILRGKDGFVEVIAAYQSLEDQDWFQGNADAIRRCLWVLEEYPVTEFLILPGHHLYKMDYQRLIEAHRNNKADITIVALNAIRDKHPGFGLLRVNPVNQVIEFSMKSERETITSISGKSSRKSDSVASGNFPSMGIYLINRDTMSRLLKEYLPEATDLGSEVIPAAISIGMKVEAYLFDGYWEDMRSIEAFYHANMECIKRSNMRYKSVAKLPERAERIIFYDRDCPVYTMPRCLPPTMIREAVIRDSVVGDGCIINRCKIKGTVIGMRTRIGDGAVIEDSVIMGADFYQGEDIQSSGKCINHKAIPVGIGEDTQIKKAVIDKNARIGKNVLVLWKIHQSSSIRSSKTSSTSLLSTSAFAESCYICSLHILFSMLKPNLIITVMQIINKDGVQEGDREANGYIISEGIVVIIHGAEIADGSII